MTDQPAEFRRSPGRRTSDTLLRRAVELAHLGGWSLALHPSGDVMLSDMLWSDEMFRLMGHAPKAFPPTVARAFAQVPSDDHPQLLAALEGAVKGEGAEFVVEHRIIRADGEVRLVEQSGFGERDEGGGSVRLIGTMVDITDRRHIEGALRGQAAGALAYEQLVQHSHDAIISCTLDGTISTWNPAAEHVFG